MLVALRIFPLSILVFLLSASPAAAASLTVGGGFLTFTAAGGETNVVTVTAGGGDTFSVSDANNTITTVSPGCSGSGTNIVTCTTVTQSLTLLLNDLNDVAT